MPIDVASGSVHLEKRDIVVGGRFPMVWDRNFHSSLLADPGSPLGSGWTSTYFSRLTRIGKEYRFQGPAGNLIRFPDPEDKVERYGIIRNLGSFHEIGKQGPNLVVTRWSASGRIQRFLFLSARHGEWWPVRGIEDESGNGLELAWDERNSLKGIRQKLEKRTLILSHDEAGRILAVSLRNSEGGRRTLATYAYDQKGRLASAADALGCTERYEYDAAGRLIREIARDGGVSSFRYDDYGRCIRFSGLDGYNLKIIRYLDHVLMTEVTNSVGRTTRYQCLASGQVSEQFDALGARTAFEYDEFGRIIARISPLGEATRFAYDAEGNRSKTVDALGQESLFAWGPGHLPVGYTDPGGRKWARAYDDRNRLIATIDPAGNMRKIGYDSAGNPVRIERPDGTERKQAFDTTGILIAASDWNGSVTRFERDDFGRIIRRIDPDGSVFGYEFDALGRLLRMSGPGEQRAVFAYDAGGNLVRMERNGRQPVQYAFGPCRRLLSRKDGNGNEIRYAWGTEPDRLEAVWNEAGEKYSIRYDAADRIESEISFDGREIRFKYDLSGRCIEKRVGASHAVGFKYDALGRVIEELADSESPVSFAYDSSGFLLEAKSGFGTWRFERDALGRVIRESQDGYELEREFDASGAVAGLKAEQDLELRYAYDANGLVGEIDANGLGKYLFRRNALGQIDTAELPGGAAIAHEYDSRRRLTGLRLPETPSLEPPFGVSKAYTYDESDLVGSADHGFQGVSRYSYDGDGRLIRFETPDSRTEYALAANGDIRSIHSGETGEIAFAYAQGGRLISRGGESYTFDSAGRMSSRTGSDRSAKWVFEWDARDRLRAAIAPDGRSWSYRYDPLGRRHSKTGPEGETRFIWDQDVPLLERHADGAITAWGFDPHSHRPLFKIKGGSLYSILSDRMGTPCEMLDARGNIVWAARLDPWGNPIAMQGDADACPFRFQGQYFDAETGLHYNRFRYYDPKSGRYLSPDPARLRGGISAYQYVRNPMQWIDPLGLCGDEEQPSETVFRGERSSNAPEKVFEEGLRSKGDNMDLLRHATANQSDSGFIATSQNIEIAEGFAGKNGFVYEIETNKGINVNDSLGDASPFPEQHEVAVPREIPSSDIKGAYPVKGGTMTGEFIPNPNFGGGG